MRRYGPVDPPERAAAGSARASGRTAPATVTRAALTALTAAAAAAPSTRALAATPPSEAWSTALALDGWRRDKSLQQQAPPPARPPRPCARRPTLAQRLGLEEFFPPVNPLIGVARFESAAGGLALECECEPPAELARKLEAYASLLRAFRSLRHATPGSSEELVAAADLMLEANKIPPLEGADSFLTPKGRAVVYLAHWLVARGVIDPADLPYNPPWSSATCVQQEPADFERLVRASFPVAAKSFVDRWTDPARDGAGSAEGAESAESRAENPAESAAEDCAESCAKSAESRSENPAAENCAENPAPESREGGGGAGASSEAVQQVDPYWLLFNEARKNWERAKAEALRSGGPPAQQNGPPAGGSASRSGPPRLQSGPPSLRNDPSVPRAGGSAVQLGSGDSAVKSGESVLPPASAVRRSSVGPPVASSVVPRKSSAAKVAQLARPRAHNSARENGGRSSAAPAETQLSAVGRVLRQLKARVDLSGATGLFATLQRALMPSELELLNALGAECEKLFAAPGSCRWSDAALLNLLTAELRSLEEIRRRQESPCLALLAEYYIYEIEQWRTYAGDLYRSSRVERPSADDVARMFGRLQAVLGRLDQVHDVIRATAPGADADTPDITDNYHTGGGRIARELLALASNECLEEFAAVLCRDVERKSDQRPLAGKSDRRRIAAVASEKGEDDKQGWRRGKASAATTPNGDR